MHQSHRARRGRRATLLAVTAGLPMAAPLCVLSALAPSALAQGPLTEPFPAALELADLDGTIGFRLDGIDAGDQSGFSVASAGDVNGDGIDDLIIGARFANPGGRFRAGESYVVFGRDAAAGGFPATFQLADLDGTNGFRVAGVDEYDRSGWSVASAGDVNGDGVDDLVVGAYTADPSGRRDAGATYVIFGRDAAAGGFPTALELADLDGSNGFRLDGVDADDRSGWSVASAGDVNADGIDDLIIGAFRADPGGRDSAGETYVVFGRDAASGGFPAATQLADLDGNSGFRLDGVEASDYSGVSVASAGDANGDGIGDLIIGAFRADPGGRLGAGETYVVFGRDGASGGFPAAIQLADLDGANGFRLDGVDGEDFSGETVASAGDINGDGVDDLIIGSTDADPDGRSRAGESYVVFGRDTAAGGFPATFQLADLDGSAGFRVDGADEFDRSGSSVASAGDVNGDGIGDLIIGAFNADAPGRSRAGATYVIYGHDTAAGGLPAGLQLADLDGTTGFRLDGVDRFDQSGSSVASAGDVNGDGIDDLIIGAPSAGPGGESYVVFGRDLSGGCRADLDGDGALTIFDFLAFQNLFDAMDPAADFDGDGDFTIFDFLAFQNEFDAGCP
ncbi:MAG: integrin alpha [Phycisphaerales bacterium]